MKYKTKGVCASEINFDIVDGAVTSVQFTGGCNGNLKGISNLVVGMNAKEAIKKLKGTTCGYKSTSCPDQLAQALQAALDSQAKQPEKVNVEQIACSTSDFELAAIADNLI